MYGIGYSHTGSSFITTPGSSTNNSWGMYVAADGDARIWLGGSIAGNSYFNTTGSFGIGTSSPSSDTKLHVKGNGGIIRMEGTDHCYMEFYPDGSSVRKGWLGYGDASNNKLKINNQNNDGIEFMTNNTSKMLLDSNGSLSIGTAATGTSGTLIIKQNTSANNLEFNNGIAITSSSETSHRIWKNNSGNSPQGAFNFGPTDSGTDITKRFVQDLNGNVGIGGYDSSKKLYVAGDLKITGDLTIEGKYTQHTIGNTTSTSEQMSIINDGTGPALIVNQKGSNDILDIQDDGISAFYIQDGGDVGVGTTTPNTKLHIYNSSSTPATGANTIDRTTTPSEVLRLQSKYHTGHGSGALMRFTNHHGSGDNPSNDEYNLAAIAGIDDDDVWGGGMIFYTSAGGNSGGGDLVPRILINSNGNVGIGSTKTNPLYPLDIDGSINISSANNYKINGTNLNLLNLIAKEKKLTFISTGMSSMKDIVKAKLDRISNKPINSKVRFLIKFATLL